jgi:protocatechuate 3,4-dioxygenase beta subunit
MTIQTNRRKFLIGAALTSVSLKALASDSCGVFTPAQTAGPFYPGERNFGLDTDLTRVPGSRTRALGQVIYVRGKVLDSDCRPVEGVNVEIWQACASGKYNSPRDPNPARLDPNFKYWAETFTNQNGEYMFKTIRPGAYPAAANWDRPPHIHVRVSKLGYGELVTQMYFKGEPLNDVDDIILDLPRAERDSVIVDFTPSPAEFEPGSLMGSFEITLRPVRRRS